MCGAKIVFGGWTLFLYPVFRQTGSQVVYSKYAGTELEFNGSNHLLLKEDDIVGILETDDIKDLKPMNERVLIKVSALIFMSWCLYLWFNQSGFFFSSLMDMYAYVISI